MTFSELGVPENFVNHLASKGITQPSPVQEQSFQPITLGESLVALSKTGTGKTLAYLLPLFLKQSRTDHAAAQNSLLEYVILVPTRELAYQVRDTLQFLSLLSPQKSVIVIGGEAEEAQIHQAKEARWIVATPGRLLDLVERKLVNLKNVHTLVFDEADRILDMGFIDDVRILLKFLPQPVAQMLFFSATLHLGIEELAYEFGVEFKKIGIAQDELTVEGLDHEVAFVGEEEKFHALCHFLSSRKEARGIVFSNYREKAHELSRRLKSLGAPVEGLSAQLSQAHRLKIMEGFRSEKIHILVASDLAARGLDVQDLDFVVNYDLPEDPATYVHRVGRTARAGKSGIALSLVGFEDAFRLERLEKFLGKKINRFGFEPSQLKGPLPRWPGGGVVYPAPEMREGIRPEHRSHAPRGGRHERHQPRHQNRPHQRHEKSARVSQRPDFVAPLAQKTPPQSFFSKIFWLFLGKLGIEKKRKPKMEATPRVAHERSQSERQASSSSQRRSHSARARSHHSHRSHSSKKPKRS